MPKFFRRSNKPPEEMRAAPGRAQEAGFDWRSFDAVAGDYDRVHAAQTVEVGRDLLVAAGAGQSDRVIDVGAGTGALTVAARDATGFSAGVDASSGMLRAGKATRPNANLIRADVLDLPFPDETFDVALLNFTLPYFKRLDTALFDVLRVLRPSGRVAASVWTGVEDEFTKTWRALIEEAVGKEVLRDGLKDETPWVEALADPKRLDGVLRDAGLRPVTVETRTYRFHMSREDYIVSVEVEAAGRFVRSMLGPELWASFRGRVRSAFAERFPENIVDLRDALIAVGHKP